MSTRTTNSEIARRFVEALERQDVSAVSELFAPDAAIWHCTDEVTMSLDEMLGSLTAIATVAKAEVTQTGYWDLPDGFLLTATSSYVLENEDSASWHAAMIVRVDGEGRITRLDEFLDSAGTAPILRALS